MAETSIEWTHAEGFSGVSWNPTRGCDPVSPGCARCYAGLMASRFSDPGMWGHGYAERNGKAGGGRWTGKVNLIPEKLAEPLRWRKPRQVFVNSMSDLFHEKLTFEEIAAVIGVIAACPKHRFLTLTKRAERMREWFEWIALQRKRSNAASSWLVNDYAATHLGRELRAPHGWPLSNWWLGVSVEDRKRKDRIDHLRQCPAAVRFLSCEPLLEDLGGLDLEVVHWVIAGGESGPGSRQCRLEWIDAIREQCRDADVAFFCKQLGANVQGPTGPIGSVPSRRVFSNRKGGDPSEWPGGLERFPREMPIMSGNQPGD